MIYKHRLTAIHLHLESDITDLGDYLLRSGGTMLGDLNMENNNIKSIGGPTYDALVIGDGTPVPNNDLVQIVRTFNINSNGHGFEDRTLFSPTDGARAYASYDTLAESAGTQNIDHMVGLESRIIHGSSGTIDSLIGFMSFLLTNNGGTATDLIHFNVATDAIGTGDVTNQYGLKIANLEKGTNNWAIHTGTGLVHFGDKVDVNDDLEVSGDVKISGSISQPIKYVSNGYVILPSDHTLLCNTDSIVNILLPSASANPGKVYYVKNALATTCMVNPDTGDTIDNLISLPLNNLDGAILQSDGVNIWHIIASNK